MGSFARATAARRSGEMGNELTFCGVMFDDVGSE